MDEQNNAFAVALKEADERIAWTDNQCDTLRSQLEQRAAEKTILLGTRHALLIQVGDLPPEHQPLPQTASPSKRPFKGLSLAAAARKYLFDVGQPQTHAQVVEGLLKGNVKIASKHPATSIRSSMQKRPDWFRWVKEDGDRGRWELVEWPPQSDPPADKTSEATTVTAALPATKPQLVAAK